MDLKLQQSEISGKLSQVNLCIDLLSTHLKKSQNKNLNLRTQLNFMLQTQVNESDQQKKLQIKWKN